MSADFIDSNVVLYHFDDVDERKRSVADAIVREGIAHGSAIVSFQVVQETLNVLTRKLGAGPQHARRFLDHVLLPLWRVAPSRELYASALDVHDRYGYGFCDALIIASAQQAGCRRLLSEDLRHGQRIGGLRIVDPFRLE